MKTPAVETRENILGTTVKIGNHQCNFAKSMDVVYGENEGSVSKVFILIFFLKLVSNEPKLTIMPIRMVNQAGDYEQTFKLIWLNNQSNLICNKIVSFPDTFSIFNLKIKSR